MAEITAPTNALTTSQGPKAGAGQSLMVETARRFKVSPFRQFADMARLRGGASRINPREYYEYQLFRADLTPTQKKEFVGETGSLALNLRMAPPAITHMRNFLADKVGLTAMMGALGLPTTKAQAAFSPTRGFGLLPTLRSAAEVEDFLRTKARFPLFGKPIQGAQAMGAVMILGLDGDSAHLSTGTRVAPSQIAAEVAQNLTHGYVFQDAVTVAPEIAALTGCRTVSTLRVVTVNRTGTPEVLYTSWKLPSLTAMSDNFWQPGSLIACVNPTTGVVEKIRHGSGLDTQWVETHPVSGVHLKGITLPHFKAATDLAVACHAVVPDNGLLGWDIALVPGGACLIECNENTGHALYQLAADRGVLNADFLPVFTQVAARNARLLTEHETKRKAYQTAKARF